MSASGSGAVVLIPLVDLFSNILMLFMANHPVFNAGSVDLPKWAANPPSNQVAGKAHQLEAGRSGRVLWDQRECAMSGLEPLLRQSAAKREHVSFRMDSAVPFDTFWRCYQIYSRCGFERPPSLVVSPDKAASVKASPSPGQ